LQKIDRTDGAYGKVRPEDISPSAVFAIVEGDDDLSREGNLKRSIVLMVLLVGCSAVDDHQKAQGDSGPPPGVSYRVQGDDTSQVYAQATDYCKTYGNTLAKLDKLGDPQGTERIAQFSCHPR